MSVLQKIFGLLCVFLMHLQGVSKRAACILSYPCFEVRRLGAEPWGAAPFCRVTPEVGGDCPAAEVSLRGFTVDAKQAADSCGVVRRAKHRWSEQFLNRTSKTFAIEFEAMIEPLGAYQIPITL